MENNNQQIKTNETAIPKTRRLTFKNYEEFMQEFKDESDRAAVILGVAKIDTLL
jgi:hypothetical protein